MPVLLLFGNKALGISSSLRHICAVGAPTNIPFFKYNWRKEKWNLFFVAGITAGGFIATTFLANPNQVEINPATITQLQTLGVNDFTGLMPADIFSWQQLLTVKGIGFMIAGGFLVGFGTRYAGGCTSGHSIMGLSSLQWPSLVATICFMAGGFFSAWIIVPWLLSL